MVRGTRIKDLPAAGGRRDELSGGAARKPETMTIDRQRVQAMATSKATVQPAIAAAGRRASRAEELALVERCRKGDLAAFETIYRTHSGRLYSVACRMLGNPADAEDMLQEIFLAAHRKLDSFRGESALGTWLFRLATNLCLDHLRSRAARARQVTGRSTTNRRWRTRDRGSWPSARWRRWTWSVHWPGCLRDAARRSCCTTWSRHLESLVHVLVWTRPRVAPLPAAIEEFVDLANEGALPRHVGLAVPWRTGGLEVSCNE